MIEQQYPIGAFFQRARDTLIKRYAEAFVVFIPNAFQLWEFNLHAFERLACEGARSIVNYDDLINLTGDGFYSFGKTIRRVVRHDVDMLGTRIDLRTHPADDEGTVARWRFELLHMGGRGGIGG